MSGTVSIIGFGRFGPVLAQLLNPHYEVLVHDLVDVSAVAEAAGARQVSRDEACATGTVFVAVPIRRFKELVAQLADCLKPGDTVIDTCSVKVYPATVMKEHLPDSVSSIATHPLFGPDSVISGLKGLSMMMHPVSGSGEIYTHWRDHFAEAGLEIIEMSPEEHDRLAARSQGLTHFIGRVLESYGLQSSFISTEGYRDLQMVVEQTCHDSIELFQDLENYNPYTPEMTAAITRAVEDVKQAITRR